MKARLLAHVAFATALLSASAWVATPAHAVNISATATAANSQPNTMPVTQDLINGDFTIGANSGAGAGHVTGDGVDETTRWASTSRATPTTPPSWPAAAW